MDSDPATADAELEKHRFHIEALVQERTSLLDAANAELQAEIIERKAVEAALERERANLQAVFDMVNVGMLLIDEAGGVKRVNSTLTRWLGGSLPEPRDDQPGDFLGCIHALADPAGCGGTDHCTTCSIRNTFEAVFRTGQPVHGVEMEAGFSMAGKTATLWLEISADLLDLDGTRHVVLAMNNITPRKHAEQERERLLKEVERHAAEIEGIFEAQQDAVLVYDTAMKVRRANPSFWEVYGFDPVGLSIPDIILRLGARRADGRPLVLDELPTPCALRGDKVTGVVFIVTRDDGVDTIIEVSSSPVRAGDCITGSIAVWHDISERVKHENELRKLNRILRANSHSAQAMMRAKNELDYLNEVCKIVVEDCGHAMLWIGFAEHDDAKSVRPVASAGFEEGYLDSLQVTWADAERGRGPTGTAIRTGKPCGCRNMRTDPAFAPWREEALRRGYASSLVLPLLMEGKAFGAISVYSREADAFGEDEAKLLAELCEDLVFGILALRMRDAHAHASELLGRSEARYRALFNGMTEGFALHQVVLDEDGAPRDYRFLEVNPAFERLTGLRAIDIVGRTLTEVLPDDSDRWVAIYGKVALTGEAIHFEDYSAPLERWFEVFAYSPAPLHFAVVFMDITGRKEKEEQIRRNVEALEAANEELARFNRVATGRELRMVELKKEVNDLCAQANLPARYAANFEEGQP